MDSKWNINGNITLVMITMVVAQVEYYTPILQKDFLTSLISSFKQLEWNCKTHHSKISRQLALSEFFMIISVSP
jgi:hypothetical protein